MMNCKDWELDQRSFHTFDIEGVKLLFDRATSATLELNEFAYEALSLIEAIGFKSAIGRLRQSYGELEIEGLKVVLGQMVDRGMFRFQPLNRSEQDKYLDSLWAHAPYRIQMLMAQGCNLGCRYCYAWRNGSNQKHTLMPFEIAKQAVNYLVWRSRDRVDLQITFFGGEPLLNYPVIKRVVEYCRKIERNGQKRFVFELCTNATLMDREVTDFLVAEKFWLFMSIDGWREMHNYNRPSMEHDDLYDTIVGNARYAQEQYRLHGLPTPKVRANLTNKFNDFRRVGEHLESLGFSKIDVGAIEPLPHGDASPAALTEDQADELQEVFEQSVFEGMEMIERGERMGLHHGRTFGDVLRPLERLPVVGVTCGIGRNTLVVDNRGFLFPCHRYEGMGAYVLGDVFTGLDREKTMAYYRRLNRHAHAHCEDCWIRDYCGGGCVWLLSAKDGHIADPTDRECQRRRRSMELRLWARAHLRKKSPERFATEWELPLDQWDAPSNPHSAAKRLSLPVLHLIS
jgi:uncharacterized protein